MMVEEHDHDESRQPPHILVVDDEPFIRNAFKLYLETHGYKVSSAACGEQALSRFRDEKDPIDLILLDLIMPGLQGIELLQRVKSECSHVEVIIATGCGSMNSAIDALRLGAFDFITKPIVDFDRDLLTVVQKALANRQSKLAQLSSVAAQTEDDSSSQTTLFYKFYNDLEALASTVTQSTTRASAQALVESFFEQHFRAVGGLVMDHSSDSMSVRLGWGIFHGRLDEGVTASQTEVDFSRMLLASASEWGVVSPDASVPMALRHGDEETAEPLEVLRIPLVHASEPSGTSTDLLVFRQRQEVAPPPPPQTELLALVVNAALSKSMVTLLA